MWERLTAPEDVFSKLQRDNLAIFESYWAPLMEVVCRDACDGREISRVRRCYVSLSVVSKWNFLLSQVLFVLQMLALALLDRMVCMDKQQQWLLFLSNSGYLKVLVDTLAQDDGILQNLLVPQSPVLKALYIYESKMVCDCTTQKTFA